jgi:multicomponent Na+:H+ antiporter subunit G
MMALLVDVISWACIIVGAVFAVIGAVGILRLPDVFSRMHGAGIIDTLGAGLILVGLMFQAGFSLITVKLILIVVFVLYTSPTTTHALARAALNGGVNPLIERKEASGDEPSEA